MLFVGVCHLCLFFFPVVTLFKLFSDFYFDIVVQTQYSEGHCYQLASSTKQTG